MTTRNKIIYWIATLWLASGMASTGIVQLFKVQSEGALAPPGVYGITHLGYPVSFLTILGVWKRAVYAHIASGDPVKELFPSLLLLILTVVSWYFRPAARKIISVNSVKAINESNEKGIITQTT